MSHQENLRAVFKIMKEEFPSNDKIQGSCICSYGVRKFFNFDSREGIIYPGEICASCTILGINFCKDFKFSSLQRNSSLKETVLKWIIKKYPSILLENSVNE